MKNDLKVLIVEDDAVIAQLLEHYLMSFGYHVLDVCHNSERALDKIHNLQPDLVLLDINIEGSKDGINIAEIIDAKYKMPYIFITALSDQHTLRRAEEVHPVGYIVKPFREDDLRASITIGMSNHQRRNSITEVTLEYVNSHAFDPLSGKEYEILNHIAKGYTNTQIAEKLELSTNTVKWHTQNIYSKLGVKNRTAAAQFLNGL